MVLLSAWLSILLQPISLAEEGLEMPILKNKRHEKFALNLLQGMSQTDAARKAGYTSKWVRTVASRLSTNINVLRRVVELGQMAESDGVMTVRQRKERLSEIGSARLTDYVTCGPDRDLISVGPESPNTGALQGITSRTEYDKDGAGVAVVTKIKLHGPIQAIAELNKMDHIYEPDGQLRDVNIVFVIGKGYSNLPQLIERKDGNSDKG